MSETRVLASDFQADPETRRANAARFSGLKHEDECFLCGRGLTASALEKGWSIHLGTDGSLLPADATDVPDSLDQGWFPVGSECAKRLPLTHRARA